MTNITHKLKQKAREEKERRQAYNVVKGIIIALFLIVALGLTAYYVVAS